MIFEIDFMKSPHWNGNGCNNKDGRLKFYSYFTAFCIFFLLFLFSETSALCHTFSDIKLRSVNDQTGRKVNIPKNPVRVVSLAPSVTEIIFDLKRQDILKGVTRYSDFPAQAGKLPKIGSYIQLDIEKIVSLKPDLCIAVKDSNPIQKVQRLYDLGIPVYVVNPVNLKTVLDMVTRTGEILKAEKMAQELVSSMKSRLRKIKLIVSKSIKKPKVFFQIGIAPIVSAGTNTFLNELIELSGGINLGAGKNPYPRFSIEQVIRLNPDIILISSMARSKNDNIFTEMKQKWETWKMISAVKHQKIFIVDSNIFDRPTPRLIDALEMMAHIIHPELFKKETPIQ